MSSYQQNSNYRRGPTGIGMGVGRVTSQPRGQPQMPGASKSPRFNQYEMDHDDDFEDEDFGDVDEHQENDVAHYKNTEARDDLNHIEGKMMQARNFNAPSSRTNNGARCSGTFNQKYSLAGQNNIHQQQSTSSQMDNGGGAAQYQQNPQYTNGYNPVDSHFNQMSQGMLNIQTSQRRIETVNAGESFAGNDNQQLSSRESQLRLDNKRKSDNHNDFFERQQKMIQESKMRSQNNQYQPTLSQYQPTLSQMPDRQQTGGPGGKGPGSLRGPPMQNNFVDTAPSELKQFKNQAPPQQHRAGPQLDHQYDQDEYDQMDEIDTGSQEYGDRFEASKDAVEGTKNFDQAYDKLVKKFYKEEGANLLIPQEDMMYHEYREENKLSFNIEERQRKYAEQERRKQEKIRLALIEKERKEMEECSFAPKLHKKKLQQNRNQDTEPRRVKTNAQKNYNQNQQENHSSSRANEATQDDELDHIRDVDTFVADQERFLQQKRIKEQIAKQKQMQEEEQERVPKINKKSRLLLQQRQERLEQQKLKEKMERLVNDENYQSMTSRLKKPTTSLTRIQKEKSQDRQQFQPSTSDVRYNKNRPESPKFRPQISKNTEQLVENRKKRLQQNAQIKNNQNNKQNGEQNQANVVKASDKYLIQKFNKEFDQVRDQIINLHPMKNQHNMSPFRQDQGHSQQYSPNNSSRQKKPSRHQYQDSIHGVQLNYLRFKDMLIQLGLLTDMSYANSESQERQILYDLWKILRGEETEMVYIENLRVLVQVILRLIDPKRVIDTQKQHNRQVDLERTNEHQSATVADDIYNNDIGFKNEKGQICIRTSEVQKIQSHFNVYYLNRLQFYKRQLDEKKNMKQQEAKNQLSFKPQIATNSTYLANERKKKIAREMGLKEQNMTEEVLDPANFLMHQGNLMKFKKEQYAKRAQEEKFKKEHTFEPDTKLTKNKVIPRHPRNQLQNGENLMRTSVSSINLDGIAKKKTSVSVAPQNMADPFDQEKKPRHAELYNQRKRQIDKVDKSKQDYEFERQGQECTFAPKLYSNPKYLRRTPNSRQGVSSQQSNVESHGQSQGEGGGFQVQKKNSQPMSTRQRQLQFEQKQLERMKKAREEKMRKNAMFERGEPTMPKSATQTTLQTVDQYGNPQPGITERMNHHLQASQSPTMAQQRHHNMGGGFNNRRSYDRSQGVLNHDGAVKYRSRGHAMNNYDDGDQMDNLQQPDDSRDEHQIEEDIGPMSLTINTKQFDENYNENYQQQIEQQEHEQSESVQFALDEQEAQDQTVKQQYPQRRSKASRLDSQSPKKKRGMSKGSQNSSQNQQHNSATVKQRQSSLSKKQRGGVSIQENYGLDQDSPHGNMFDHQATDLEESTERYDIRGDGKQQNSISNAQEEQSFQNNTLPQMNERLNDDEEDEEVLQGQINNMQDEEDQEDIDGQQQQQPLEDEEDEAQGHFSHQTQQQPLLFVDINLGGDEQERIVVYEGDTAVQLALNFCQEHNLDEETQEKLQELLEQQMAGVLPKVDEEEYNSEEEEEDYEGQQHQAYDGAQEYGEEGMYDEEQDEEEDLQQQQQHDGR